MYVGEKKARVEKKLEEKMEEVKEALKEEQRNLRGEDEDRLRKRRMRKGDETPVQKPWRPDPTQRPRPSTPRPAKKCYQCGEPGHLAWDHGRKKKTGWDDRWLAGAQYRGDFGNGWWHERIKEEYEEQGRAFDNAPWGDN